eukprot:COSAG02_NODE_60520_length_271_cov_0.598837_1_plen_28_part_10
MFLAAGQNIGVRTTALTTGLFFEVRVIK